MYAPRHAVVVVLAMFSAAGCDATKVASECVAADLVGQCPVGSNPLLGAVAASTCGGEFNANVVTDSGSASGQCNSNGSCEFLCQFEVPCSCGVATLTKDAIVCSECPNQSCGDGRCEGTERVDCAAGAQGCFACAEDCTGPTCGDGDCTGTENPQTCPQDCADLCTPNASTCVGTRVSNCAADGRTSVEFDCDTVGQVCSGGACVAPNVCGNGICEGGESTGSCAVDCSSLCDPSSKRCEGNTLVVCSADGKSENETECGEQICASGQCRPRDVCGNGVCEAGENATCAQDCAAVCGNHICENNEAISCPGDCTTCGNGTCEAGEITTCPQDCGICVPSEKQCLGRILRVCNANGTAYDDVDCDDFQLSCGGGNCVEPGVCGNGVCESNESVATCAADCSETCGNGTCGGTESFQTCASDCDPICGDGTCEGNENSGACSFDCLASCGDGTCAGPEDRQNCPGDCGFCGDGACQDGFESASLNPPNGLSSCVVDCVVSGCSDDSDCNDDVACTANQCRNGSCIYTPDDALCTGDDKCIRLNGCCPDADDDGYADEMCGGSDCNDGDPGVHPGALEVCGGGDMNCNGQHKPALLPAKKLSNSAAFKSHLTALDLGETMLLAWTGKPATTNHLQLLDVGWDLLANGAVRTVEAVEVNPYMSRVSIAWNPVRGKLGAWWVQGEVAGTAGGYGPYWNASVAWLDTAGTFEADPRIIVAALACGHVLSGLPSVYATGALARGDTIIFPTARAGYNTNFPASPWHSLLGGATFELTATGNATPTWGEPDCNNLPFPMTRPVELGGLISGLQMNASADGSLRFEPPVSGEIVTLDPAGTAVPASATLGHASSAGDCVLGDDGELLVLACQYNGKVFYHRVTQAGGVFLTAEALSGAQVPIAIGKSKPRIGGAPTVGTALRDASGNLWFFVRDAEGGEVLAPAIIGGGDVITSAQVMHDGNDFVVIWLAKSGGFEQAFGQRVTCE